MAKMRLKLIENGKCIDNGVMFKNVSIVTFGRIRKVLRNTLTGNPNIVVQSTKKEV